MMKSDFPWVLMAGQIGRYINIYTDPKICPSRPSMGGSFPFPYFPLFLPRLLLGENRDGVFSVIVVFFQAPPVVAFPIPSFTTIVTEVLKAADNSRDGSGTNPGDKSNLELADLRGGEYIRRIMPPYVLPHNLVPFNLPFTFLYLIASGYLISYSIIAIFV